MPKTPILAGLNRLRRQTLKAYPLLAPKEPIFVQLAPLQIKVQLALNQIPPGLGGSASTLQFFTGSEYTGLLLLTNLSIGFK